MSERLLGLVEHIYDAALDPALWAAVLSEIADFVEGERATLISEDLMGSARVLMFQSFVDPEWNQRYLETYLRLNPFRLATASFASTGDVFLTSDVMEVAEFRKTRFFTEWLQSRQLIDNSIGIVERTSAAFNVLAVQRHDRRGAAGDGVRERIRLILPHVRRAVTIGRVLDMHRVDAENMADTLDHLACGVFILGADRRITFANEAGRRLMEAQSPVRSVGGVLSLQDKTAEAEIAAAFTAASGGTTASGGEPDSGGEAAIGGQGTAIPILSGAGTSYVGNLLPLRQGRRQLAGAAFRAVAVLFVRQIDTAFVADPMPLARIYGLTPRELTVMAAIAESSGARELADVLGLSLATVRSHLKSIFLKTGTRRQADLVKLVANARAPFV